ncbi:unnamed protein product [Trichogramma brassicae]|uniref:Uncharacterized protein n=1 Tax=Trichogramma brassicae TaxID=86971 RepID=A0A6H5J6Y0_9HYME|nr:unnamed protein product [Trichogramma brassicae]
MSSLTRRRYGNDRSGFRSASQFSLAARAPRRASCRGPKKRRRADRRAIFCLPLELRIRDKRHDRRRHCVYSRYPSTPLASERERCKRRCRQFAAQRTTVAAAAAAAASTCTSQSRLTKITAAAHLAHMHILYIERERERASRRSSLFACGDSASCSARRARTSTPSRIGRDALSSVSRACFTRRTFRNIRCADRETREHKIGTSGYIICKRCNELVARSASSSGTANDRDILYIL